MHIILKMDIVTEHAAFILQQCIILILYSRTPWVSLPQHQQDHFMFNQVVFSRTAPLRQIAYANTFTTTNKTLASKYYCGEAAMLRTCIYQQTESQFACSSEPPSGFRGTFASVDYCFETKFKHFTLKFQKQLLPSSFI